MLFSFKITIEDSGILIWLTEQSNGHNNSINNSKLFWCCLSFQFRKTIVLPFQPSTQLTLLISMEFQQQEFLMEFAFSEQPKQKWNITCLVTTTSKKCLKKQSKLEFMSAFGKEVMDCRLITSFCEKGDYQWLFNSEISLLSINFALLPPSF